MATTNRAIAQFKPADRQDPAPAAKSPTPSAAPDSKQPAAGTARPGVPAVSSRAAQVVAAQARPGSSATPAQAKATPAADKALAAVRQSLQEVESGAAGKVNDITPTVTALPPADRNSLVSRLSDKELQTWMQASGQYMNPQDQQPLFDALAEGLDNRQLGRVITSLDRDNAVNADNAAIVGRFGDAVAAHKPPDALRQFVQSAAGRVEGDQKTALVVAKALVALGDQSTPSTYSGGIPYTPPNRFETALAGLSDAQLDSVLHAAAQERFEGNMRSYDPQPLAALLDRAAGAPLSSAQRQRLVESGLGVMQQLAQRPDEGPRHDEVHAQVVNSLARLIGSEHGASAGQRAELFELTAQAWGGFAGNDAKVDAALATSLKGLLATDTNAVMGELETQFREGAGMTRFVREMIAQGRADELKPFMAQLQLGNDLQGDPMARFGSQDGAGNHRHANVLGYFVGSVYAGVSQLNKNADDTAGVLGDIFDLTSIVTGIGGRAVDGFKFLTTQVVEQRIDDYKNDNTQLRDTVAKLAYPAAPDGRRYEGSAAEAAYDSALGRVIDNNG
jgi:hypothetical protein